MLLHTLFYQILIILQNLKELYEEEKENILNYIKDFVQDYEVDESDILKRLLLKRIIYGVD